MYALTFAVYSRLEQINQELVYMDGERVDHHHESQIGVLIKPAMDKRAAGEKGVDPRIRL